MFSFVAMSVMSVFFISLTGLVTYEGLRGIWAALPRMHVPSRLRVLLVIGAIFGLHILNIWIYALGYFLIENFSHFGTLTGNISAAALTYGSFVERLYFSASTYASLGLGDIVPTRDLRMLTSAEVLNGLVLLGWTISFTYLTMETFWAAKHPRA